MRLRPRDKGPWLVVLAGGDGERLTPLTRSLYGYDLPKQFAVFRGTRSLLQKTLVRLRGHAAPERTIVVSTRKWAKAALEQLRPHPGVQLMLQPMNLGTGVGALLPLACIRAIDPEATVIVSPSDHHVERTEILDDALVAMTRAVATGVAPMAIAGITPDRAETDYGWLLPGAAVAPRSTLSLVKRFVEKPDAQEVEELMASGGLWNSLLMAASVESLWALAERELPAQAFLLQLYGRSSRGPGADHLLARIFERLPPADFSRALLAKASGLTVTRVTDSGWSDLGTPQRVLDSLRDTSSYEAILYRLARPEMAHA